MARWSCDDKTVGTGRECGTKGQPGGATIPRTGSSRVSPSRGDVTALSPRLPSGALLALTAAMTAATAVVAALPASAGAAAPGGPAAVRAGTAPAVRSDRVRAQEWWLGNLHVPQAWQVSRGAGITVAVLSSGVEATHPDLTGSVVTGPDFTGSGEVPGAPSWAIEGTSTASIIAGHGDNVGQASGIIGVAPAARILSIRVVLDATDPLNANPADVGRLPAAIAAGIRYAAGHGAQVIDLPLDPASLASDGAATGGLSAAAGGSAAERAAVNYALAKGSVLVAPAGDNGEDGNEPTFPASYPGVIALGAVDRHFVRAPFSIRQSYVALTAPGVNLTTASPPSGYRNMSTTGAASAIVAGVAALIRSRYPALTGSQVRQALLAGGVARPPSATTPGDGAGTVDALKAVEAAALIAAPRASASAPSTSPAKAQAPPGKIRPAESHPATGILSRAKAVLRDAAMAAGMLIVLLLASLIGIRVRRRRAERATLPAPEPRTLLSAPSGLLAAGARHTRAAAEERAAAAHAAAPGAARVSAHGLPVRVTPVPRTVTRAEVSAPGGPPWDPAPMPEGEVPHEPVQRAPDPFARFAPPAPATSAPWDADQPGPVAGAGPIAPPRHTAPPPGHVARSGLMPPHHQVAPPGRPAPMVPPQPGPPHRRGQFGPGGVPGPACRGPACRGAMRLAAATSAAHAEAGATRTPAAWPLSAARPVRPVRAARYRPQAQASPIPPAGRSQPSAARRPSRPDATRWPAAFRRSGAFGGSRVPGRSGPAEVSNARWPCASGGPAAAGAAVAFRGRVRATGAAAVAARLATHSAGNSGGQRTAGRTGPPAGPCSRRGHTPVPGSRKWQPALAPVTLLGPA